MELEISKIVQEMIMSEDILWGMMMLNLNKEIINDDKVPLAAIAKPLNGGYYTLIINKEPWQKLSKLEKIDIFKHELFHIMLGHFLINGKNFDKQTLNIAQDVVINWNLKNIPGITMWPKAKDYMDYIENNKEKIENGEIEIPIRGVIAEDFGFTEDDVNKGYMHIYNRLYSENSDILRKIKQLFNFMSISHHNSAYDGDEVDQEILKSKTQEIIKRIVNDNPEVLSKIGNIPNELRGIIDNILNARPPIIDWKRYVRRFVVRSFEQVIKSTRLKINKRIEGNPTIKIHDKACLFVSVDTSGSVSDSEIKEAFTEIHHMWKSGVTIIVGECDAKLTKDDIYEYKGVYPKNRKGLSGGGGTSVDPCIKYVNDNINKFTCHIHITDGEIPKPKNKTKLPTLIIITPDRDTVQSVINMGFKNVLQINKKDK